VEVRCSWDTSSVGALSGTVTFLFTDVEGSTRLWDSEPETMRAALARHDEIVRSSIDSHGGRVFATGGDGFAAAFHRVGDGLGAALEAQQRLGGEEWPGECVLRVRMGLHVGEVDERDGNYFGSAVNRAARLMAVAHGGQTVLSQAVADLAIESGPKGVVLRDLGVHRLKDLSRPERIFQLGHSDLPGEFPQLRSLDAPAHNLPVQRTSFIGRLGEVETVKGLLLEEPCHMGERSLTSWSAASLRTMALSSAVTGRAG
jgi:class 3 adenylate cyclase